jgi:transposase
LIHQDPDITLKELQGDLADAHDVTVSVSGIDQALKRLGYTYKKRAPLRMNASAQG